MQKQGRNWSWAKKGRERGNDRKKKGKGEENVWPMDVSSFFGLTLIACRGGTTTGEKFQEENVKRGEEGRGTKNRREIHVFLRREDRKRGGNPFVME